MRTFLHAGALYLAITATAFAQDTANSTAPSSTQTQRPALVNDRGVERSPVSSKMYLALQAGNFDLLESTHQEMLAGDERFTDGTAKLSCFYSALAEPREPTEDNWKDYFAKIDAWRAAKPDSIVADAVKARALTKYAWFARGTGWANTVTPEGWKLMGERLAEARQVLERSSTAHQGKDIPPGWYEAMQTVALGQQWSREEYDKMFDEAVATYPNYEDFYFSKAYYLQPKWYGQPGDWQAFAVDSGKKQGLELYARICWASFGSFGYDKIFTDGQVSWPEMKMGFEGLEKKWPASGWNINAFCRFACAAHDKETAKRLFDKMGDIAYTNLWGTIEDFNAAKAWANSTGP